MAFESQKYPSTSWAFKSFQTRVASSLSTASSAFQPRISQQFLCKCTHFSQEHEPLNTLKVNHWAFSSENKCYWRNLYNADGKIVSWKYTYPVIPQPFCVQKATFNTIYACLIWFLIQNWIGQVLDFTKNTISVFYILFWPWKLVKQTACKTPMAKGYSLFIWWSDFYKQC